MERPSSALTLDLARRAPKVLLHDHLDGGLRPRTVLELAAEAGYRDLPTTDPDELAAWFTRGADRKSLELYLEGFRTPWRCSRRATPSSGSPRSAPRTSRTTASSTPRYAWRPSC